MDNREFDEFIRGRLEHFELPPETAGAIPLFDSQPVPAVTNYRFLTGFTTGMVSILLLLTLTNLSLRISPTPSEPAQPIRQTVEPVPESSGEIALLKDSIDHLLYELQVMSDLNQASQMTLSSSPENASDELLPLGTEVSAYLQASLQKEGLLVNKDGQLFLRLDPEPNYRTALHNPRFATPQYNEFSYWINLPPDISDENAETARSKGGTTDLKTSVALEKHYYKGVGIRLGPVAQVSWGLYDNGEGKPFIAAGINADLSFSHNFSVETGLRYSKRSFESSAPAVLSRMPELPGQSGELNLTGIESDAWMIEIPVIAKLEVPLTHKLSLLPGAGTTLAIYTRQELEFNFETDDFSNIRFDQAYDSWKAYWGGLTAQLGLQISFSNGKQLESSLYYQKFISPAGKEAITPGIFGFRNTYWIRIR